MPELINSKFPRVSVIIPLYNKEKSIENTLWSVLKQTVHDFEIVVVDDGSTDGSADIVQRFQDARIRLIQQSNAGESAARNRGIIEAKSDLLAFIDADDLWLPHFLETVLALRTRFPHAGAYSTAFIAIQQGCVRRFAYAGVRHLQGGELVSDYFYSCTLGSSLLWSSSVLIPRHVFDRVGYFPDGVRNGADLHMWARIALEYPIAWSTMECAIWNLDAENRIAGRVAMTDVPFAKPLEDAIAEGRVPVQRAKWVRAYIAKFRILYAAINIAHGNRIHGLKLLWLARGMCGKRLEWWKTALKACTPDWLLRLRERLRSPYPD